MKNIWMYIDGKDLPEAAKYRLALRVLGCLFSCAGLLVWLVLRNWILSGWEWLVCFMGYPFALSWFVVLLYSCDHGFHDGKRQ